MTCANAALLGTQNQQVKINKQAGHAQVLAPWRRVNAKLVKTKWFFCSMKQCRKELGHPHSLSYSTVPGAHVANAVPSGLFHAVATKCSSFCMFWSITCFYVRSLCEQSIRMCYLHEASRPWTARPCFALIINVHRKMIRAHMQNIVAILMLEVSKSPPSQSFH